LEPKLSVLLPCCHECRDEITSHQSRDPDWYVETTNHRGDWLNDLLEFYEIFQRLEQKIDDYVETVNARNDTN